MKPKLSIIIPVYNVEKYLERCLKSLIQQKGDFELVCIDDGSPDRSGSILDYYQTIDPRVKVFHKENGGVSSARNMGIEKASAEFLTFIDPDDWVSQRSFAIIEDLLSNNADLTCFNFFRQTGEKEGFIAKKFVLNDGLYTNIKDFYKYLFDYWVYADSVWNKIYKKSILDKYNIRFRPDIKVSEDKTFNLDYMQVIENIYVSSDTIYYYFYNPGGAIRIRKLSYLMDYEKVFFKKINLIKKLNLKYDIEKIYITFLEKIFMNYDRYIEQGISEKEISEQLRKGTLYKVLTKHYFKGKIAQCQQQRLLHLAEGNFFKFKLATIKYNRARKFADFIKKKQGLIPKD